MTKLHQIQNMTNLTNALEILKESVMTCVPESHKICAPSRPRQTNSTNKSENLIKKESPTEWRTSLVSEECSKMRKSVKRCYRSSMLGKRVTFSAKKERNARLR